MYGAPKRAIQLCLAINGRHKKTGLGRFSSSFLNESADFGELTRWQGSYVLTNQFFGSFTTAAAIGGNTQALAHFSVALALLNGVFNLLVGNGFAQTHVHMNDPAIGNDYQQD